MSKLYLASTSVQRRRLLREAGIEFEAIEPGHADERVPEGLTPVAAAEYVARMKVRSVRVDGIVLAADTIAALDGRIFGKPADLEEAFLMLRALQGTTHEVITGVALVRGDRERVFHEISRVTLGPLSDAEIRRYHARVDPLTMSGACGIQERADILRVDVEGSESNVIGLPIERIREVMQAGF